MKAEKVEFLLPRNGQEKDGKIRLQAHSDASPSDDEWYNIAKLRAELGPDACLAVHINRSMLPWHKVVSVSCPCPDASGHAPNGKAHIEDISFRKKWQGLKGRRFRKDFV